ncbi:MAG: HEAT repeat domain-containing protein [Candidatus Thiodiazotropha lotti]|uniref:HEAT repeat domain-containing protein n=1 Tax=Candidatus Thiodiazotropha endoloripes TaxID=1818881 RepID=UPI00114C94D2|nr:HEAT repeat domain-containing protein [Candidatus Thiodiazotropha endoloripes]MCG7990266.1 HEAT repeat domain-containing protein [Candidatus Thiodiazotropha lotti]MCG7999097.1 HEAT repeat domain-containing protein [Candidatus Thiodiazotropha lotti]MCW4181920.1 HEAT repeat domain-containing protein [Candidatus Thiodiazotropha weberae]MCW4190865.1 HEAT repeat domain-containing protein [Candidatus Thiodiazotropha weberae]
MSQTTMNVTQTLLLILFSLGAASWLYNSQDNKVEVGSDQATEHDIILTTVEKTVLSEITHLQTGSTTKASDSSTIVSRYPTEEMVGVDYESIEILEEEKRPDDHTIDELKHLLSHSDPIRRLASVYAIGEYKIHDAITDLMQALYDPDPRIRVAAVESLAMLGHDTEIGYLEPALYDSDNQVRITAVWAIADVENEQGIYLLAPLLSDSSAEIRINVVAALGEIGDTASIHYLENQLNDTDERVRWSAAEILKEMAADY